MPEYNDKLPYRWEPTDQFIMTGKEFGSLYHMMTGEMNSPMGAPLAHKVEVFNAMMRIFKDGVKNGVIVENKEEIPGTLNSSLKERLFT